MPKLRNLTAKLVIKILEQHGFRLRRTSGSHFIFDHPITKKKVIVPHHTKDLAKGTLLSILKQAGMTKDDLP